MQEEGSVCQPGLMFSGDYGNTVMGSATGFQYIEDTEGGYARGPERALLTALLFEGIQSFMNYVTATSENGRNRYKEAYNWVLEQDNEYVFSFNSVCEALGVNADFYRLGLMNVVNTATVPHKKKRRKF